MPAPDTMLGDVWGAAVGDGSEELLLRNQVQGLVDHFLDVKLSVVQRKPTRVNGGCCVQKGDARYLVLLA